MGKTHPAFGLLRKWPGYSILKGGEPRERTEPFRIILSDSNGSLLRTSITTLRY
jgi:hypothetical protein